MPKTSCLIPICMRQRFNGAAGRLQFSFDGSVAANPGVMLNHEQYEQRWATLRAGLVRPFDFNCEAGCQCVKFSANPSAAAVPVPIVLAEWDSGGKISKWEVVGVTVDIWIGTCALAGSTIRIGDAAWQQVNDIAPGPGFSSALAGSGGGHKKAGRKKKKATKRPTRKAKASRGRR